MLDAYIIDAIRREELEREQAFERRRVYLEIPAPYPQRSPENRDLPDNEDSMVIPIIAPRRPEEDAA